MLYLDDKVNINAPIIKGKEKKMKKITILILVLVMVFAAVTSGCQQSAPQQNAPQQSTQQQATPEGGELSSGFNFQPMKIRFFVGGEAGDAFASIVYKGAMDAAEMLQPYGVEVDYVFSGWQPERMISQLREAIAAGVDAICMMGHPGSDAVMPLAEEAKNAGIIMMYQNTDVAEVRSEYGGGYAGVVDLEAQGVRLGTRAIEELDLQPGDRAVVFAPWGSPGRYFREEGVAKTFEKHGMIIERIVNPQGVNSDPQLLLPLVTGQVQSHPETKIIVYSGGQLLAAAGMYMEACDKAPGEIYNIGFDLNAAVLKGFSDGYVQLSSDQQPYLQGFLPIMNAFLAKNFSLSGLQIDTGASITDTNNYNDLKTLVDQGYR